MQSRAILKKLAAYEATTITEVLKKLEVVRGKRYPRNSFTVRLKNGTVSYDEIADIADILGYEILFVKKDDPKKVVT